MQDINEQIFSRLTNPNNNDVLPPGWFPETVEVEFNSEIEAKEALQRVKEVALVVAKTKKSRKDWPHALEWKNILPKWLLNTFHPEYTKEELNLIRRNIRRNKQGAPQWTLDGWSLFFNEKVWEWWGGKVEYNKLILEILVDGHPFGIYELKHLLELCGAKSIKVIN